MATWNTKIPARFIDFGNKVLRSDNYIFGVKLVANGGGFGTWMHIDENENIVDLPNDYFENHPIYKEFNEENIKSFDDDVIMMYIPKFYIRTADGDKFWIAPDPKNEESVQDLKDRGFRLHPAFYTGYTREGAKREYDGFYIGAYPLSKTNNNLALSTARNKTMALVGEPVSNYSTYCTNRNVAGADDYHMWTIYELSAIQMLALLEHKTTNLQKVCGRGRVSSDKVGQNGDEKVGSGPASAKYRGIYALWGNAWQLVDGIKSDKNNTLLLWAGDGRRDDSNIKEYGTTGIILPNKKTANEIYIAGENSGYYNKALTDVGARYNCSDMFLPDFTTLTARMELGTYSDYVYCPVGNDVTLCAVGGSYNSEDEAGLFAYNFNILPSKDYDNVTSRLAKY